MKRTVLALLTLWVCGSSVPLVSSVSSARAQELDAPAGDAIALVGEDCPRDQLEAIGGLVALELAPRRVELRAAPGEWSTRARLRCEGERATLGVIEPGGAAPLTLELELRSTPHNARTRLIALTLSELIVTARLETAGAPAAVAPSALRAPGADAGEDAYGERSQGPLLWLGGGAAWQGEPMLLAPSLQLGALLELPVPVLGVVLELQGQSGSRAVQGASVRARGLSAGLSLAAWLRSGEPLALVFAAGGRAGYAELTGSSNDVSVEGRSVSGAWFGPTVGAALHVHLDGRWALRAAFDLDYVARPLRGSDPAQRDLYVFEGLRASLMLGVAFRAGAVP